jgi:hypothetical protein
MRTVDAMVLPVLDFTRQALAEITVLAQAVL